MIKQLSFVVILVVSIGLIVASLCYNQTAAGFYRRMTVMKPNQQWIFNDFPKHLQKVSSIRKGEIISSGADTLSLVCCFPNQADTVNRYLFYILKDNHGNVWSLFHEEDDKFHLYREDPKKFQQLKNLDL